MARIQFVVDDPAGARATLKEISGPDRPCNLLLGNLLLAACHAALGESEAAHGCAQAALTEVPDAGLKLREASRPAGLPE